MIQDLKKKITELENKILKKQTQFIRKKQLYEEIIKQLQDENERLKVILAEDQSSRSLQKLNQNQYSSAKENQKIIQKFEQSFKSKSESYSDLLKENHYLKTQISQLSLTYQKQIDQLTYYFEKIKHENNRLLPMQAHYTGKITYLENAYLTLMKDYDRQRQKYRNKILTYANQLQLYEDKMRTYSYKIEELEDVIEEKKQTEKIFKRIKS